MLTKDELERKFTLKNRIVATTPKEIPTEIKREKRYRYIVTMDERELLLSEFKDLIDYCKDMCLYRNNEKVTEVLLSDAFKLRDTIILHKMDKTPVKVIKEKTFIYTLDNQDTVIPFEGIERLVDFLNQHQFRL